MLDAQCPARAIDLRKTPSDRWTHGLFTVTLPSFPHTDLRTRLLPNGNQDVSIGDTSNVAVYRNSVREGAFQCCIGSLLAGTANPEGTAGFVCSPTLKV